MMLILSFPLTCHFGQRAESILPKNIIPTIKIIKILADLIQSEFGMFLVLLEDQVLFNCSLNVK
jgi:hypothetical protein